MIQIVEFLFPNQCGKTSFVLQEFYTKNWQPYFFDQSGPISIGHHFEWAFLLSTGVEKGLPVSYLNIAEHLLETALDYGFNQKTGAIFSYMNDSKQLTDSNLYWWDFSEALRTMMHFIVLRNRNDLITHFNKIFDFVETYFIDPDYSGWYTKLDSKFNPDDTSKGSLGKLDYHQTALCLEAIRLQSIDQNLKKEKRFNGN
jgi:mannose/cellobiose epimerase-like protein (N-acyl-D-glucosamine 2-epimerase family)